MLFPILNAVKNSDFNDGLPNDVENCIKAEDAVFLIGKSLVPSSFPGEPYVSINVVVSGFSVIILVVN